VGEAGKLDVDKPAAILDAEDEETLAAVDRGSKAADEGRLIPLEEVRQRRHKWLA
jgi:predicted transcriptional regulator